MIKVFMEYKIKPERIEQYRAAMKRVGEWMEKQNAMNYKHYEAVDQTALFVEMFDVRSVEEYERLKRARREERTFFEDCVVGGKERIHMWAFKETADAERF